MGGTDNAGVPSVAKMIKLQPKPGADAGLVQVFPLDDLGAEVSYDQNKEIDNTPIEGSAAANDHFGEGLGFVAGTERSILIGVPDDVEFSSGIVNVIPLPGGPPRSWRPSVGGEVQQ